MPLDDVLVPFLDKEGNRYSVVANQVGLLQVTSMAGQSDGDEEHPGREGVLVTRRNSFERENRRRKYRMRGEVFTDEAIW